jgi:hypothetical protein
MWAWEPEKNGVYSVRSAYRLLDTARIRETNIQYASTSGSNVWRMVWKLKVPPKIKVFWWRVLHEFIPSRQILHRRHIEPIAHCEVCGSDSESMRHVLVDCSIAKTFWFHISADTGIKLPALHSETWAHDLTEGRAGSDRNQQRS